MGLGRPRRRERLFIPGSFVMGEGRGGGGREEGREGGGDGGGDGGSRGAAAPRVPFPRVAGGQTLALPASDSWKGETWSLECPLSKLAPSSPAGGSDPRPARRRPGPGVSSPSLLPRAGGGGWREGEKGADPAIPFPSSPLQPAARGGSGVGRGRCACVCESGARRAGGNCVLAVGSATHSSSLSSRTGPPGLPEAGASRAERLSATRAARPHPWYSGAGLGSPAPALGRSRLREGAQEGPGGTQSGGRSGELPNRAEHRV